MQKLLRNVRTTIAEAFRNTPVEVLIIVVLGALFSLEIEDVSLFKERNLAAISITGLLALCAVFATSASAALKVFDNRIRWVLTAASLAALTGYGAFVLDMDLATELWRWAFLAVAAVMGVMLVPVAARIGDVSASERFWRYNIRLFSRVAVSYAYGLLLYAGIGIGIAAIDGLFDLSIKGDVYGHLFVWVTIVLGTILAVGSLADVKRIGEPFTAETLVWSGRLGTFLFMPLVLLYLGIMYVYLAKVLGTSELPSNILSPLALGAGMLGYFGLFVLQPHMHREDFKPLAKLLRAFPAAFIPVVPFGIYAVSERIGQYGWTEFRYARMAALVCLGAFSVIGAYKWARKQEFSLVTGPAILGIAAALGAVGPWGASNVSEVSQLNRLEAALDAADLRHSTGALKSAEVVQATPTSARADEIRSSAVYLLETHGDESIAHLSPVDLGEFQGTHNKLGALGIDDWNSGPPTYYLQAQHDEPYRFPPGGGVMTDFSVSGEAQRTRGFETSLVGRELCVTGHDRLGGCAMLDFELPIDAQNQVLTQATRMVPIMGDDAHTAGMIALNSVHLEERDGVLVPTYVSGMLALY